jgi:hypothetical protein
MRASKKRTAREKSRKGGWGMTDSKMLDAALNYAARGLLVYPLRPDSRETLPNLVPHGFKDATTDEAQTKKWGPRVT